MSDTRETNGGDGRRPIDVEKIGMDFFSDKRISGLLSAVMALSAEVLVLKARLKSLSDVLEKSGVATDSEKREMSETRGFSEWLAQEANQQTAAVLRPMLEPDQIRDVRALVLSSLQEI